MKAAKVEDALSRLGLMVSATEGHGLLCGLICARGYVECEVWVALMDEENLDQLTSDDPNDLISTKGTHLDSHEAGDDGKLLRALHRETVRQLGSGECDFYPLLPDDNAPLDKRTEALGAWCQSFLFGLAAGGIKDFSTLPEQVGEISRDLVEFSRMGPGNEEPTEQEEFAYVELVEYVRVGVLLIFEALHSSSGDEPAKDKVLH
ncbi:MAG: UPF0149 family protein [Thiotrichaceae bacterium]|nr:UPF0149 family protein [Thiotrichaceae bacterium]PCI10258.1 MAG: YecA family protein [Thiotrichales bacterium]PCI12220.1 MAG: YecA family protein [Thiotrichales bacterium]